MDAHTACEYADACLLLLSFSFFVFFFFFYTSASLSLSLAPPPEQMKTDLTNLKVSLLDILPAALH